MEPILKMWQLCIFFSDGPCTQYKQRLYCVLYQALNDGQSKVKLFYIQEQDVDDAVKEMPADLPEASPGFHFTISLWFLFS